jgi:hypothetical protein
MPDRAKGGSPPRTRVARKAKRSPAPAQPSATTFRLPRVPKGKPARFHRDPAIDQLFGIVAALTGELSVVAERLATLERVLERRGGLGPDDIERYEMDDAEAARRTEEREALIERTFQVLETAPD